MKVKVGNTIYDGEKEPVMVILSNKDRENIQKMHSDATKYCSFPDGWDKNLVEKWMS